ncbi:MAG: four helix bundle protein [Rhodothermales bacterium]
MMIRDFQELRVYRRAFEAATKIYELSKRWLKEEQYALTDQVRRSSRSVCANIAEAWFKRRYPKHFVSKLSDAGSEASETLVWIDFARQCGYLSDQEATILHEEYRNISGGVVKMMTQPEKWCAFSSSVREEEVSYGSDG